MGSDSVTAIGNGVSNGGPFGKTVADHHMEDVVAKSKKQSSSAYSHIDKTAARQLAFSWANAIVPYFCLKAAVRLGLPSILTPGSEVSTEEIARRIVTPTGQAAHKEMLERILRVLASYDLVHESFATNASGVKERRFEGSPVLEFFQESKDDHQGNMQETFDTYIEMTSDTKFIPLAENIHIPVLDNSQDPLLLVLGHSFFDPEGPSGMKFHRAMTGHAKIFMKLLLDSEYDGFKSVKTLVDVGGALGLCISSIVTKYPSIRGICFDLPHVVAAAPQHPGVEFVGGSFFESIPACDAVFMKCVLHDWSDENCVKILKTIHKALPEDGKVINFDAILPETSEPTETSRVTLIHNCMMGMVNAGGQERSLAHFRELGAKSGFPRVELMATVDYFGVFEFYKK